MAISFKYLFLLCNSEISVVDNLYLFYGRSGRSGQSVNLTGSYLTDDYDFSGFSGG